MIQQQTSLKVADNSGGKKVLCVRIIGSSRYGFVGDIIVGVIKAVTPNLSVKRSDVVRAVIVRTKHCNKRNDGTHCRFNDNAVVIINNENNPRGTRVLGSIARELKEKGFTKIISLAPEVL